MSLILLGCVIDVELAIADCAWEADPPVGTMQAAFPYDDDCTCETDPRCHSLYVGEVRAIDGLNVEMAFQKTTGESSYRDNTWCLYRQWEPITEPTCADIELSRNMSEDILEAEQVRAGENLETLDDGALHAVACGLWLNGITELIVSDVYTLTSDAWDAAPDGAHISYVLATDGADSTNGTLRWFTPTPLNLFRRCSK